MCVFYSLCVRVNRSAVRRKLETASLGKWNLTTRHRHDSRLTIDRTHAREVSDSVNCDLCHWQDTKKGACRTTRPRHAVAPASLRGRFPSSLSMTLRSSHCTAQHNFLLGSDPPLNRSRASIFIGGTGSDSETNRSTRAASLSMSLAPDGSQAPGGLELLLAVSVS